MKINIVIITILLIFTSLHAFKFKWPYALLGNNPANPRFIQILKNENKISKINKEKIAFKYNLKISIIKETDTKEDLPVTLNANCELSKDNIILYENERITNEISYLE